MSSVLLRKTVRCMRQTGAVLFAIAMLPIAAFAQEPEKTTEIHIATPSWAGQTNEDGSGMFFDIVRTVYEPAGIKMKFEIVPWKRAESMISAKEADAYLSARKRKDRLVPRYPLWVEHTAVVFRKDRIKEWKGMESLNNKNLLWMRGYDFHTDSHLNGIQFKWQETDSLEQAWKLVEMGRYDAYIEVLEDLKQYAKTGNADMNLLQIEVLWGENSYMAFAKREKSEKLMQIYDKRIKEIFDSGELEKLFEKWGIMYSPEAWRE
ncbi:MAG: substrate-binding periplasmic protein [Desulfococcaceae bacterium]